MEKSINEALQQSDILPPPVKHSVRYEDIRDEDVELTPEEEKTVIAAAIRKAKGDKAARLRAIAYHENISKPIEFPPISAVELGKMIKRHSKDVIQKSAFNPEGGLIIDDTNREIFKLLCLYYTKDPEFEADGYSLSKGIILFGNIGCGKTTLMKLFQRNPTNDYVIRSCRTVADDYTDKHEGGALALAKYSDLVPCYPLDHYGQKFMGMCFDDLGTERNKKHFGNEINVMEDVFQNRYDLRLIGKTHLTTNLSGEEIAEIYGPRVASRLREMCNIIPFPSSAGDRRK